MRLSFWSKDRTMEPHEELGLCGHCGGQHDEINCPVKETTNAILQNYKPRGMTRGVACPNCDRDGTWHWWPKGGADGYECECGEIMLRESS